jgi:hypothetical protein
VGPTVTPRRGLVLAGILALASVGVARAQETEAERAFVRDFVAALNSQSLERRLVLVHPGARTCTAGEVGEWWREAVVRQARDQVPEVVRTSIAELGRALPFADRFDYPVAPTHQLQLDYALPGNRSRTIVVLLARDGARWTEVVPCARADTVAAIAAKRAERAKEAERIKALAARTSPELRTSVVKLYRAGRRVDAFQAYIQASGEDLATAKAVVELLAEGSP